MRITYSKGEHLVVLGDEEAALPARLASVLNDLFVGLKAPQLSFLEATREEPISEH